MTRGAPPLGWLAFLLALLAAPGAWAHAQLVGSDPPADAVLEAAPAAVRLDFNEPVAPLVLRWVFADGRELTLEGTSESGGAAILVAVPPEAGDGSQLLVWRVASIDGHAVGGSLGFAIGEVSAAVAAPSDRPTAAPAILTRFLLTAALAFGVGGVVFARLIDVRGQSPAWATRLARAAALAVLPATVLAVATQGLDLLAAPWTALAGPEPWWAVLTGRGGLAAGLAVAAALLALAPGRAPVLAAWGVAALSFAVAGHAATASPVALTAPAAALHGFALIYWLGALPPLAAAAATGGPGLGPLLHRFSAGAVPLVAALVISGTALAAVQLDGRPGALLDTPYGRLLATKLALVSVMLALATWNRWRLTPLVASGAPPAGRRLARSAATETLLAVAILALVSGFRVTPPPLALAEAAAHATLDGATLTLRPGRAGPNEIGITLAGTAPPRGIRVGFAMPAHGIEPIRAAAREEADGTWRAGPVYLPMGGNWEVTLRLAVSDFESKAIRGAVALSP